jgi:hypothetical protein
MLIPLVLRFLSALPENTPLLGIDAVKKTRKARQLSGSERTS